MPDEYRRAYMREYMRERRAEKRKAAGREPRPNQAVQEAATSDKGDQWMLWLVGGFMAVLFIAMTIKATRRANQEEGFR